MTEQGGTWPAAPNGLRAVVVGAGFAGEGHTRALQACGVAVEAICARTPAAVDAMAAQLGVPRASTDWRRTLAELRPDIVGVATPAGAHAEIVEVATSQGAHLYCDKPLAPSAPEARRLYHLARDAGVKHAYAATHRYDPSAAWLEELVRDGTIGRTGEVEATFRRHLHPLTPWTWYDQVALGGGLLHNALPHWLGIVQRVLGGELLAAVGEARVLRTRAPYVPDLHDFRLREAHRPTEAQAADMAWRQCDSDNAFTALFQVATRGEPAQVSFSATGFPAAWPPNGFRFHGSGGTLRADGHYTYAVSLHRAGAPAESWEPLPVPERLLADLPPGETEFQRKWTALARDFVADVLGRPHQPYLTLRDGWRFQEAFDAIRAGSGWTALPAE